MTRALLATAAVLAALFGAAHLAGLRAHTAVLSGTDGAAPLGVAYVLLYFAFAVLCPVLVLAAGLYAGGEWALRRRARRGG